MEMLLFEFWFDVFLLCFIFLGIVVSAYDNFSLGTIMIISWLALLQWIFDVPVWTTITNNPFIIVVAITVYVLCGTLYTGLWKFPNFVKKNKLKIQLAFENWVRNNFKNTIDKQVYITHLQSDDNFNAFLDSSSYPMSASNNKNRLASWVLMWPFALALELSYKPAMWLWEIVYNNLGEVFQQVSKNTALKNRVNGKE